MTINGVEAGLCGEPSSDDPTVTCNVIAGHGRLLIVDVGGERGLWWDHANPLHGAAWGNGHPDRDYPTDDSDEDLSWVVWAGNTVDWEATARRLHADATARQDR